MSRIARVPITNVHADGDYTCQVLVGPSQTPLNVILDTGSSALALDGSKHQPDLAGGDASTTLAQTQTYADGGSWTGAVVKTSVTIGAGEAQVALKDANAAIAYACSSGMFRQADGVLGLAYAPLDGAFAMPSDTWGTRFTDVQVRAGNRVALQPYLAQLGQEQVAPDIISFLTRRSFVHQGGGGDADPLNQGWMIVGGGTECTDLYVGEFQSVKVLSDAWYCTNLKAVIVGAADPIAVPPQGPAGAPSNSIVDSGSNSLNLSPPVLDAVLSKFHSRQQALLAKSARGQLVGVADLDLAGWPALTLVMQGEAGDVQLTVAASSYWQVNTDKVGAARVAISQGRPGFSILGLPLMNGHFTVFDGQADGGMGVIRFAAAQA